jgi:hypothetical protein
MATIRNISGFLNLPSFLIDRQDRLGFRLGSKQVVAINESSIIVEHSPRTSAITTWCINNGGRTIKPIISIEVPSFSNITNDIRQKKRAKGIMAEWRHAGQIFCEMLGQICHPELYSINTTEYLDVSTPSSCVKLTGW